MSRISTHYGWLCAGCEKPTGNLTRVFCKCGVPLHLATWGTVPSEWVPRVGGYTPTAALRAQTRGGRDRIPGPQSASIGSRHRQEVGAP